MKKVFCFLALLAVLAACGPKSDQSAALTSAPAKASSADTIAVFTVVRHAADSMMTSAVNVAFPVPDKKHALLVAAVNEWISEQLGGTYGDSVEGDYAQLLADTAAMAEHYFKAIKENNEKQWNELGDGMPKDYLSEIQLFDSVSIEKLAEGLDWITFQKVNDVFQGGAHGSHLVFGQTFRKSDGRRIGWDIIRQSPEDGLQELMRKGILEYMRGDNDKLTEEEAMDMLDESAKYYLPMPQCPPIFTEEGILFLYNQYEIAPYALGLPQFILTWEKVMPYLNVTAKRMIK